MSGSVGQGVLNFKIWKHLIWGRNGPCKKLFKIFSYIIWVIIVSRPNLLIFLYTGFEDVSRPDFSYQFLFIRYPKFKDVSRPCQFLNKNANPSRWVSNPVPLAQMPQVLPFYHTNCCMEHFLYQLMLFYCEPISTSTHTQHYYLVWVRVPPHPTIQVTGTVSATAPPTSSLHQIAPPRPTPSHHIF